MYLPTPATCLWSTIEGDFVFKFQSAIGKVIIHIIRPNNLDRTRQMTMSNTNKTNENKTKQTKTKQNKRNKRKQNKRKQNKTNENKTKQTKTKTKQTKTKPKMK